MVAWALLPAIAACACTVALDATVLRRFALPLGFFLFAVPIWEALAPELQALTVEATTALISAAGIHAFIDGNFVHLRSGSFETAGGCAGTNYLVAALAVRAGHVERLALGSRVLLVAAFAAAALAANWGRVALVIAAGDATAMQSSLVRDHWALAWVVFAVAVAPFLVFVRGTPARDPAVRTRPPVATCEHDEPSRPAPAWTWMAAVLAGGAWSDVVRTFESPAVPTLTAPLLTGWNSTAPGARSWRPVFPRALAVRRRTYVRGGREVDAYAAFLGAPAAGRETVGEPVRVGGDADAHPSGWATTTAGRVRE